MEVGSPKVYSPPRPRVEPSPAGWGPVWQGHAGTILRGQSLPEQPETPGGRIHCQEEYRSQAAARTLAFLNWQGNVLQAAGSQEAGRGEPSRGSNLDLAGAAGYWRHYTAGRQLAREIPTNLGITHPGRQRRPSLPRSFPCGANQWRRIHHPGRRQSLGKESSSAAG